MPTPKTNSSNIPSSGCSRKMFYSMPNLTSKSSKAVAALPADHAPLLTEIEAWVQPARVRAGANVLVFGRFEFVGIWDSRPTFVLGLGCLMPSNSLKWRLSRRRRPSGTKEAKKEERRTRSMARPAEFIHFRLGADTVDTWPSRTSRACQQFCV